MEKLTIQEEEVMIYIWELQDCFVKDIVSKFPQPAPPYTTVASIVKNLERNRDKHSRTDGDVEQMAPAQPLLQQFMPADGKHTVGHSEERKAE